MVEELVRRAITSYSNEGMVVYDPFLGSSTTTRVARDNNRVWIGSEIHTPYFDLAKKIMYEY
jgi:DNA modification methylase